MKRIHTTNSVKLELMAGAGDVRPAAGGNPFGRMVALFYSFNGQNVNFGDVDWRYFQPVFGGGFGGHVEAVAETLQANLTIDFKKQFSVSLNTLTLAAESKGQIHQKH